MLAFPAGSSSLLSITSGVSFGGVAPTLGRSGSVAMRALLVLAGAGR